MNFLKSSLLLLIISFLSTSCQSSSEKIDKKIENIQLSPIKTLTKIADSILIGTLSSIVAQEDLIMLAEGQKSRVLVLDTNFKLKYILGKSRGEGPGEFNYVFNPIIKNGRIYAYDQGNQRINVFSKKDGTFIKNIKLVEMISSTSFNFFLDNDNNIYFATDPEANGKMLVKLDSNGKMVKKFGENLVINQDKTIQINNNYRELILANNQIISIGANVGIIEIHDLQGNKVNSFDISQNEPMKTALTLIQTEMKASPNLIHLINANFFFRNNLLYIDASDRTENRAKIVHFMVFKLSDKSCEFVKTVKFKANKDDDIVHHTPSYIADDAKTIYTQGLVTKQLYTFKMP